ncbi:glutamate receptor 2.2-like [Gossypium hirsutum]|uniref:Glutamate receptor 2.2-like n=1 Tax=Gossypium hirsutum TaxID=3635 RepID=A0ABM3AV18_GOSHI|nr:glutamate receptor 2.2-like [Gossypium hirsutum]
MDSDENSPDSLLKNILSSNFTGLSGEIHFQQGKLLHDPILRIVNVIGKSYNELDFWLPGIGFSKNIGYVGNKSADFTGTVIWPDDSKLVPKGWEMPTNTKPMIIGVPARTAFEKFVKVDDGKHPGQKKYDGFCIELFYEVLTVLDYDLIYQFDPHNGTYDELVHKVYNKTYDAAVGDITILANRTTLVEFTQPYAETGLSMIDPVKPESSAWMFLKPCP